MNESSKENYMAGAESCCLWEFRRSKARSKPGGKEKLETGNWVTKTHLWVSMIKKIISFEHEKRYLWHFNPEALISTLIHLSLSSLHLVASNSGETFTQTAESRLTFIWQTRHQIIRKIKVWAYFELRFDVIGTNDTNGMGTGKEK